MGDEFDLPDDGFGFYDTGIEGEEEPEQSQTVVEEQQKPKPKPKPKTSGKPKGKGVRKPISIDQEAPYLGVKGPHALDWMRTIDSKRKGYDIPDKTSVISELDNVRDSVSADEKEEADKILRAIVDTPGAVPRLILGSKTIKDRNKFWDLNRKVGTYRINTPGQSLSDDKDFDGYRIDKTVLNTSANNHLAASLSFLFLILLRDSYAVIIIRLLSSIPHAPSELYPVPVLFFFILLKGAKTSSTTS